MATETPNLNLVLPGLGEFTNNWNVPLNQNFTIIDTAIGNIDGILTDAQGSQASLNARLSVSMNPDGSLLPIPEVAAAETSQVYGQLDPLGNPLVLNSRILLNDFDNFYAWEGRNSLLGAMAQLGNDWKPNSVVQAANNYLTFSGATVRADGTTTTLLANINGFLGRIRTLASSVISGPPGAFFMKLTYNPAGVTYFDSTLALPNPTFGTTLQFPANTGPYYMFQDNLQNFVTLGVQPGDVLNVTTSGGPLQGKYVVYQTAAQNVSLTNSQLLIKGVFSVLASNQTYQLIDPYAATLGFTMTDPGPQFQIFPNVIYIGTGTFDGTNVLTLTEYQKKNRFSQWQSVTLVSGNFTNIYAHQLGFVPTKFWIFGSQANDYTAPLIPLGVASGASGLERNVLVQVDRNNVSVANATSGLFYKDFEEVSNTTGFLLVTAEL